MRNAYVNNKYHDPIIIFLQDIFIVSVSLYWHIDNMIGLENSFYLYIDIIIYILIALCRLFTGVNKSCPEVHTI